MGEGDAARARPQAGRPASPADAPIAVAAARAVRQPRRPQARRRARRVRDRPGGPGRARRRRVDRRLHRRPAAARRDAASTPLDVGRGQLAERAPARPAGRLDGADERPDADRRDACPSRSTSPSIDVSFISLGLVLGPVASTLRDGRGPIVALVKPQFEAGRGRTRPRRRPRPGGPSRGPRADVDAAAAALGLGHARASSPRRSRARRATASSSSTSRPGPAAPSSASGSPSVDRAPMTVAPHRLRLQPDDRGGGRAQRARRRLVPDARHRPVELPGGRHRRAVSRELPTTDVLVVLGGDGTFLRAARAVAEVDVPLLGINLGKVGFLSKAEAGELEAVLAIDRRRASSASRSGWPSRAGSCRGGARADADAASRAQRHRHRPRLAGPRLPARRRDRRRRTSRRSSPTASSSPARPARPATRSRPAARSSTRSSRNLDRHARSRATCRRSGRSSSARSQVVRCTVVDAYEALVSIDGREDLPLAVGRRRRGPGARAADPARRARAARSRSGTCSATRSSCCRRDRRRTR